MRGGTGSELSTYVGGDGNEVQHLTCIVVIKHQLIKLGATHDGLYVAML